VRILLPPSEAKASGGRGRPFQPADSDASPGLVAARRRIIDAVLSLIATSDERAVARALALPPSAVLDSITKTRAMLGSPTMPAVRRYSGTVYEGLSFATLSPGARRRANRSLLIFSGLLGVAAGREPIPDYRVPAQSSLPGLGTAGTYWRPHLRAEMDRLLDDGLLVDLRSADYASMWRPRPGTVTAERLVTVRILSPKPNGDLAVISYPSKHFKGKLAAGLLEAAAAGSPPTGPADVVSIWRQIGGKRGTVQHGRSGVTVELETFTSTVVTSSRG
jgi:cytoplasmic iron level regulating protein YaaA (DUF328/UPF0246 family)